MPRSGPRTVQKYSGEFKLTAVRFSQQPGCRCKRSSIAVISLQGNGTSVPAGACSLARVTHPFIVRSSRYSESLGAI